MTVKHSYAELIMDVYLEENLETCYNKSENERVPLDFTRLIWSSRCESFSASAESCKYFWELLIMSSAVLMSRASCLEETCLPKSENLQRKNQGIKMTWGYIFGMVFHFNLKTLPKAQRTRGLSSSCQSSFLRSYHNFKHKSWSHFIFRISTKLQLKIPTKHQHLH